MTITYRGTLIPLGKHTREGILRSKKDIAFPAVDGIQVMHMGKRVKNFSIKGLIDNLIGGAFKESNLEGFNDTGVGNLNLHGESFDDVEYVSHSIDRVFRNAVTDNITATFTLNLRQLRT